MSAVALLQELRAHGVVLRVDDGAIDVDAPPNVLTREMIESLRLAKPEILLTLHGEVWLDQARQALDTRLSGSINRSDLAFLRDWKYRVLCSAPEKAPEDPGLLDQMRTCAQTLSRQVEALDLLVRGLNGAPIDRSRLATLTLREAWRMERSEVLHQISRPADERPE